MIFARFVRRLAWLGFGLSHADALLDKLPPGYWESEQRCARFAPARNKMRLSFLFTHRKLYLCLPNKTQTA